MPLNSEIGRVYGKWTVTAFAKRAVVNSGHNGRYHMFWLCLCECGREREVNGSSLRAGTSTSCGYCRPRPFKDEVGNKYGKLRVVGRVDSSKQGQSRWLCQCDCGKTTTVNGFDLRSGHTSSCGCLISDVLMDRNYKHGLSHTPKYIAAASRKRTALKMGTRVEPLPNALVVSTLDTMRDGGCYYCGDGRFEHIDHFVPLSRGGAHVLSNLVPSCQRCNSRKYNNLVGTEWMPPLVDGWT